MSCSCVEMSCNWCGNLNTKSEILETASIEDLKQNEHVLGLLEALKFYGTQDVMARKWNSDGSIEKDFGNIARAKLREWKDV